MVFDSIVENVARFTVLLTTWTATTKISRYRPRYSCIVKAKVVFKPLERRDLDTHFTLNPNYFIIKSPKYLNPSFLALAVIWLH
jgi:hypothetical protein